jgi:polyhydroxyalkanoate synthesis regulator protein
MLENLVTGISKSVIFASKEATKGIVTAKAELNPQFLKTQAGALAKFELMKKQYVKANGAGVASIDMQANQMFAQWKQEQDEQNAMAEEMMQSFTQASAPKPEVKTYTAEEVQAMLAQLQAGKEPQAV